MAGQRQVNWISFVIFSFFIGKLNIIYFISNVLVLHPSQMFIVNIMFPVNPSIVDLLRASSEHFH